MLSEKEKLVLIEVQRLPLTQKPFLKIAKKLHLQEDEVITICKNLLDQKIIRRFGPSISHRKTGFTANPMTAIKVPQEKINEIGGAIAAEPEVTHCYARSGWEYNLFFMIHAKTKEEGTRKAVSIIKKVGNYDHRILFSTREFKKISFELPKIEEVIH